jgi:hypothetical protein
MKFSSNFQIYLLADVAASRMQISADGRKLSLRRPALQAGARSDRSKQ